MPLSDLFTPEQIEAQNEHDLGSWAEDRELTLANKLEEVNKEIKKLKRQRDFLEIQLADYNEFHQFIYEYYHRKEK